MSRSCSTSGSTTQPTNHDAVSSSVHAGVKVLAVIIGLAAALAVAGAAPATAPVPGQVGALKAIRVALAAGRIDGATANAGRAEIARAAHLVRTLPSGRREHVAVALEELASFSGRLTAPRALALIGQLQANDDYFAKHYAPAPKTDITDADGLVYRYFPGRCLEFHPLANFGALNARVAANDAAGAQRLADALIARGVYQQGGGIAWEYFFDYSGGRAPWLSGMAQAVAAQAFARTAALVPDEATALMREARAAYRVIPGRPAHERRRRPVDSPLFVSVAARAQRAAAGRHLAAVVRDDRRGSGRGRARCAHAARRGGDARRASTRATGPTTRSRTRRRRSTTSSTSSSCSRSSRRATRASPTPRRRFAAYQHQPPAFRLDERVARSAALLALEAGDRAGEHRRRPDEAARARRRLAHARVARAEASGRLPGARHRRRLGRRTARRSTRCRSCARPRPGPRPPRARRRRRRRSAGQGVRRRRGTRRSRAGRDAAEARSSTRPDRRHLAGRRHRARPERRRRAAAPARRSRQRARTDRRAAAGRRRRPRGARPVRRDARAADARPAVARARARTDDGDGGRLRARVRPDPRCRADGAAGRAGRHPARRRTGAEGDADGARGGHARRRGLPPRTRGRQGALDDHGAAAADRRARGGQRHGTADPARRAARRRARR